MVKMTMTESKSAKYIGLVSINRELPATR